MWESVHIGMKIESVTLNFVTQQYRRTKHQREWSNPGSECFRRWRRRLNTREQRTKHQRTTKPSKRKLQAMTAKALGEGNLIRSGICFGFFIWFCSWVFGAWKNKEVAWKNKEFICSCWRRGSKTKSESISIWQN